MTPAERSKDIVDRFIPGHLKMAVRTVDLADAIHTAIIENANEEVSRRREAERILEGCNLAGVIVVCTEDRTFLKVYNQRRRRWSTVSLVEEGPIGK